MFVGFYSMTLIEVHDTLGTGFLTPGRMIITHGFLPLRETKQQAADYPDVSTF